MRDDPEPYKVKKSAKKARALQNIATDSEIANVHVQSNPPCGSLFFLILLIRFDGSKARLKPVPEDIYIMLGVAAGLVVRIHSAHVQECQIWIRIYERHALHFNAKYHVCFETRLWGSVLTFRISELGTALASH